MLQIPEGYLSSKEFENKEFRKVTEYVYLGRDLEEYRDKENQIVAVKHICVVRVYDDIRTHCYAFCELSDGSSCLELYLNFDSELLNKVIQAHYPGLFISDFVMIPGSEYITLGFMFREPCIILFPKDEGKRKSGKALDVHEPAPVDYYHYY